MLAAHVPPTYWDAPGRDPWRGTEEQALPLLASATGAPLALLHDLADHGACRIRLVREGEHFDAMVFGANHVLRNVVAEPDRWPLATSRLILDCGDGYGNHLYQPVACWNWSISLGGLPTVSPGSAPVGGWNSWGGLSSETEASGYGGWGEAPWGGGGGLVGFAPGETGAVFSPAVFITPNVTALGAATEIPPFTTGASAATPSHTGAPGTPGTVGTRGTLVVPAAPVPEPRSIAALMVGVLATLMLRRHA